MKKLIGLMFVLLTLYACEGETIEVDTKLLTDDLKKIQIIGNQLEITTGKETILFDSERDKIISRGTTYKLMKINQNDITKGYILQVPKLEYGKFLEIYEDKLE